jgi:hypothetical protein
VEEIILDNVEGIAIPSRDIPTTFNLPSLSFPSLVSCHFISYTTYKTRIKLFSLARSQAAKACPRMNWPPFTDESLVLLNTPSFQKFR